MDKPICGAQATRKESEAAAIFAVIGVIGSIGGAIGSAVAQASSHAVISLLGSAIPASGAASAALGAALVIGIVAVYLYERCAPRDGLKTCAAGVVNNIVLSFSSASEELFPFTARHDQVDLVVKSKYWWLVVFDGPDFVECSEDPVGSPLLQLFYHSKEVCAAGAGALIGAAVGGVAGFVAGCFIAAAIACVVWIICLIAMLIAAIVAAVAALVGAMIGGQIGKALAGQTTPQDPTGHPVEIGQYITVHGNFLQLAEQDGNICAWWVEGTSISGQSSGQAPFSFTDPDQNFIDDACPVDIRSSDDPTDGSTSDNGGGVPR